MNQDYLIRSMVALSSEHDTDRLLERILQDAMELTHCDGGTVYTKHGEYLHFRNMFTISKGFHRLLTDEDTTIPPVPLGRRHVCACAALDKSMINIEDIYKSTTYDFSGAMEYDRLNGYRSCSMLVIPMVDIRDKVIGVLQLINAMDEENNTIPFDPGYEDIIYGLASLAAVCLNNQRLSQANYDLLHSFVRVMVGAIDLRTPYNANHTKNMVRYGEAFIKWLNDRGGEWVFEEEMKDPFLMSIWLHDIGKLITPHSVMEKSTRLGNHTDKLIHKITVGMLMERIRAAEHPDEAADARAKERELSEIKDFILTINEPVFLTDEYEDRLKVINTMTCLDESGERIPLLSDVEYEFLSIKRGTLSEGERKTMEGHVVDTARMLSNMKFTENYRPVPTWASLHHEYLDGSGYPDQLKGDELPREVRLITILDVYDALTAEDRPYKKPMPPDRAFAILHNMADEGKIDPCILELFEESKAWEL